MAEKSIHQEYQKLILALVVILGILGAFLVYVSIPLLSSRTVILATQPVDPFDLIRGQYITIGYEIGSIPVIAGAEIGDQVYVLLQEDSNGTSRYQFASLEKPSKDDLFIRGNVQSVYQDTMSVEYGIEQYFFERNARLDARNMEVKVKLSDAGSARIVELLHDGKPIQIQYEKKTLTS